MPRSKRIGLLILIFVIFAFGGVGVRRLSYGSSGAYHVSLFSDHAEPDILVVKIGEIVQFNSRDGARHNLSYTKGYDVSGSEMMVGMTMPGSAESGEFGADEAYRVDFKAAGSFYFHDTLHPGVSVTVVTYVPES